ncbi:MAG: helix-turn-helix domain-containing protein [Monoglobales bacterium]
MTDTNALKSAIVAKGYTQNEIAAKISISPTSFNYKLNNRREFKASEISALCKILELPDASIFFAGDVD